MNTLILKKIISINLSLLIFLPSVSVAQNSLSTSAGDVTTDGTTTTGLDKAQNGVPLVNIANPSGAGVSHNKFSDFNVGTEGLILNNNSHTGVSLLGGAVKANPNLTPGNQGARVILNEVTSTNASRLFGATEIHGRSAEYILANPNGITCNGCEFINTPRVMLGTGRPDIRGGEFMGLDMDPAGQVLVEGNGLNARNIDYFDIVTRAAKFNARVYANNLNVQLGNQYYDNASKKMQSNAQALSAPHLSLDSSRLGGIHAGRITLESTELGVGVNTEGELYSTQDLMITADGRIEYQSAVSNSGSVILESSHEGIDQNGLSAAAKDIILNASGKVTLNGGNEQMDGMGVYTEGDIVINSGAIENNTGMTSLGKGVFNTGGNFTNSGEIYIDEQIQISADSVDLNGNSSLFSQGDLNLKALQYANLGGNKVLSQGKITLESQGDISNQTSVQSANELSFTAANDLLNHGTLMSGSADKEEKAGINLNAANLTNSGDVLSYGKVLVKASNDMTNSSSGKLLSFGTLNLKTENSLSLDGRVESVGNMILDSQGDVTVHSDVISNEAMEVNAGGELTNHGSLSAGNTLGSDLVLNFNTLTNNGGLFSNRHLSLTSANDLNLTGRIVSYGNMNIDSAGDVTNKTILDSGNNINMNVLGDFKNGYLNDSQSVLADIISNGSTRINASNITNYGSIMTGGDLTLDSRSNFLNDRKDSAQGFSGNALLLSGGDTNIYADNITNSSGEIFSMSSIILQGNESGSKSSQINNIAGKVGDIISPAIIEADQDIFIRSALLTNHSYDHGTYFVDDRVRVGSPGNEEMLLVYEDQVRNHLESDPAFITAGNNLNIEGSLTNHASSLSAGKDININGGSVNNEDYRIDLGGLERVYMNRHSIGNGEHVIYEDIQTFTTNAISDFRPMLYAARNLTIDGTTEVSNGIKADPHQKVLSTANLDSVRKTGVIPTLGNPTSPVSLNADSLFNLSALFEFADPTSRYLIESRAQFMQLPVDFKGSDHFLTRTGFRQPEFKFLGDDYYMAMLVERSIIEATGRRYLEKGVGSDLEQLERLYNNAFEEGKDHDLKVGKVLSSEQIAELKKDIVWLIETEIDVNGKLEKVLIPQVYLARATRESLENPEALMEGKFVSIKSDGDIENYGKIYGHESLLLSSEQNIKNHKSEILTDGSMHLWAAGDLLNDAGRIFAGKDMLLDALGDITSNNVVKREGHIENWKDKLLYSGSIESGRTAVLSSGKDINILGTSVKADAGLGLQAKNNINIKADRLDSHKHILRATDGGSHESVRDTTSHNMVALSAGDNMQMSAGKDINIIGGQITSGNHLRMDAKDNINVASVVDRDYSFTRSQSGNRMGSQENVSMSENINHQSSNINAGGDLVTVSQGDTNIIASNITAAGSGAMTAGGSLNVLSGTDSASKYQHSKKTRASLRGTKESHKYENSHTKEVASNISFGGDMELEGKKDILIAASNLNAGRDMSLSSDGDVTVASVEEVSNSKEAHSKTNFDSANIKFNRSSVDFNWSQEVKENQKETEKIRQKQSNLTAGGNMSINSGKDTNIVSSNLMAGEKVIISIFLEASFKI